MRPMKRTVVIDVVNLTRRAFTAATPFLSGLAKSSSVSTIGHLMPAVTCSAHATYLTGEWPAVHGVVANGWYFRDECEIKFWRQSNKLVQAEKVWETARRRDAAFTCANLFWWYNMYSGVGLLAHATPHVPGRRPEDPRRLRATRSSPPAAGQARAVSAVQLLGPQLQHRYQQMDRRGGHRDRYASTRPRSRWSTCRTWTTPCRNLARRIPMSPASGRQIDKLVERLHGFYLSRGVQVILLSEYGIVPVSKPVHLNRLLRREGLLKVREEMGREQLDAGASEAFAVADHQIAHIYVNDPSKVSRSARDHRLGRGRRRGARRERQEALPSRSSALGRTGGAGLAECLVHLLLLATTTAGPPTTPAPSISIASPATTRSSSSSTRPSVFPG